jgi:hypothetical protein
MERTLQLNKNMNEVNLWQIMSRCFIIQQMYQCVKFKIPTAVDIKNVVFCLSRDST